MIKKIKVWKVVALSLVTFGVYAVVWFALRRDEMVKRYKVSIPHWWWFIAPSLLSVSVMIALFTLPFKSDISDPAHVTVFVAVTGLVMAVSVIAFWWVWQFGKAVEKITQGRMTLGWVVVYALLLGPVLQYVLQYYFNRLPKTTDIKPRQYQPSRKFVKYSIVAIVISFVVNMAFGVVLGILTVASDQTAPSLTKEQYSLYGKSNELLQKYNACVERLNSDFPVENAGSAQEQAYNKAYDTCEFIRIEQNIAADEYNKSIGK